MAGAARRFGSETSKTRDILLDCVEKLMLEQGYAAVTFRAVATEAEVTPGLVQYYFRTLDGIFSAAIQRYSERNIRYLAKALDAPAEDLLQVIWEYSWDEAASSLTTEFMALGNHRKSVQAEIAEATERVRKLQLEALEKNFDGRGPFGGNLTPGALLLLISGIPKFLELEESVGVHTAHQELVDAFEQFLGTKNSAQPRKRSVRRRAR
ncbi:TetR/AcrR family transcriptional regulator [Nocardia sp. NPDC051750]|uniref:TetR/AcrR family transcriptional regulator n=1 Tax=Nocardia sp. NPDC051750 TaxID=3364325 RepID=UPI0037AF4208